MSAPRKRWLVWLCVVFLLVDAGVAAWFGMTVWQDRQNMLKPDVLAQPAPTGQPMTEKQLQQWRTQSLGDAHRLVSIYSEPQVKDGRVWIMLSNHEQNQYAVRMDLIRLDTQQLIARTDLVDPGWRVESVPLLEPLKKGQNFCLARLSFYDPQGGQLLGETARQALINVE